MKIKNFCNCTFEDGHEFFTVKNLLTHLGLPGSAAQGVIKLILKFLPIMIMKKGEHKIIIDNRVFNREPENIFHLFDMVSMKNVEEENIERTKAKSNPEPRKPGSGRKRKIIEADITELKRFMECLGTQAHPRRRDEDAGFGGRFGGGTWKGDMYRFAEDLFQKKQEKPPSTSTVRRCGLPPNKHNSAAVWYHGDIEAKPMSVQNNLTLGSIHPAAHHCSANVKTGMEMAHAFPEDSRCTSNDDKAKLVVGPCALVNRLGKQKKSFMTNAVPQDPDHDISVGAKIVPMWVYSLLHCAYCQCQIYKVTIISKVLTVGYKLSGTKSF